MKKANTVMGSALLVMIVVLASKCLGFVRQVIIASSYGSNVNTDIYFVSSDFMLGLSGALLASLTTALVAVYIDISVKNDIKSANSVASKMLTLFLLASVVFIALVNIFAPQISRLIAPSFNAEDSARLVLYLRVFSIAFVFTAFQSIYAAVLNANNVFVPGKLYGIVYNPITIILVLLFASQYGIKVLVVSYFAANILQTLLLGVMCKKTFRFRPSVNFTDPNIKKLIMLSLPLLLSNLFINLNNIVDKAICSILGSGFASNYSYAYTLEQFITATITATLSLVLLSTYATYVAEGNTAKVIRAFEKSLSGVIIFMLPVTIITCVFSYDIVRIVYMRGQFDAVAAEHTAHALIGFAIGFGLIAVREMYIRLHFSYQDTKSPMIANIITVFLNAALSFILAKYVGILGVSLATSVSIILTIILLNVSAKKYVPDFKFASMVPFLIKLAVAGCVTLIVAFVFNRFADINVLVKFGLGALVSVIAYVVCLWAIRCKELWDIFDRIKYELSNRFNKVKK